MLRFLFKLLYDRYTVNVEGFYTQTSSQSVYYTYKTLGLFMSLGLFKTWDLFMSVGVFTTGFVCEFGSF